MPPPLSLPFVISAGELEYERAKMTVTGADLPVRLTQWLNTHSVRHQAAVMLLNELAVFYHRLNKRIR